MAAKASATITVFDVEDIAGTTRYYKLVTSGSSAPNKPAENTDPDKTWTITEPKVDTSKELYFVDQTLWSNGAKTYSEVSKSSSYEAAKEAYNKAQNAQNTAQSAQTVTDGIKTLFEIDKEKGTIKLQAGKLLEILSGGTFIVNAENYKLNEDGTVTITGGTIGGFLIDSTKIEKRDNDGNLLLRLDAGDTPEIRYASADGQQYGRFGWHVGSGALAGGLELNAIDSDGSTVKTTLCERFLELTNTTQSGNKMLTRYEIDNIISTSGIGLFKIDGKQVSYDNHKHSEYASASHTHAIKSKFDLTTHTTPDLTTAANTTAPARTMKVTNPGYYPLGITGYTFSGSNYGYINLFSCYFVHADNADGSGTISYRYRNNSSSQFSGNIKFRVLWVKTT